MANQNKREERCSLAGANSGVSTQDSVVPTDIPIKKYLPYLIFGLASTFYLYEFFLQISPGVMTHPLMRDLQIDAVGVGAISGFYYWAYTPMQLPAGLLYDRFGPRILLTIMTVICALGALLFGFADSSLVASLGRLLMGFASAFAFIGVLVLANRWCPTKYFALLAGMTQLMGSLGAIGGETPLAISVADFGWRHTIIGASIIGFILAAIIWSVVRDAPPGHIPPKKTKFGVGEADRLRKVFSKSQTWYLGLYSFLVWAPITAFAALWGVPFLQEVYHTNATIASEAITMIWVGIGLGSPFIGWFSDRIGKRCSPLTIVSAIGAISLMSAIYINHLPMWAMFILMFFFGVAASGQSLSFALVKDNNQPSVVGTAIGFNNMAVVAGGMLFQPLVGYLLHLNWMGERVAGVPVYHVANFRTALMILPLCYIFALIISAFFLQESNCEPHYDDHH